MTVGVTVYDRSGVYVVTLGVFAVQQDGSIALNEADYHPDSVKVTITKRLVAPVVVIPQVVIPIVPIKISKPIIKETISELKKLHKTTQTKCDKGKLWDRMILVTNLKI